MPHRPKLIEVALPLAEINFYSAKEKAIRSGHPSTLHLWWARRPLAACRAVLFAQLVDDPSGWPELFPTEAAQNAERERIFDIIRRMVPWAASNDQAVLAEARLEIARSAARARKASGQGTLEEDEILGAAPAHQRVDAYIARHLPPLRDPFAGGGSIPLEAQRLGLRVVASDLNPVAVLLNKVQIEISGTFSGRPPVHPKASRDIGGWTGARGLAEDLRRYGQWMKEEAERQVGQHYPPARLADGSSVPVIAWLWARTVASPDPSVQGAHVPLIASYWICKKPGKKVWLEPVVDRVARTWRFEVRSGEPKDEEAVEAGTKAGRGDFRCLLTGAAMPATYVREEGQRGRIQYRMIAVVADGPRGRTYLAVPPDQEKAAQVGPAKTPPQTDLPQQALGFRVQNYGYTTHASLYTPRQLLVLDTLADLVQAARDKVLSDARAAGLPDGAPLSQGGNGALAYADSIAALLAISVSRRQDRWTAFTIWYTGGEKLQSMIRLSAMPMTWEFAEGNPFSDSTGNFLDGMELTAKAVDALGVGPPGRAVQVDARDATAETSVIYSTDPPYFDNVPYADLSDLFYVWLRRMLLPIFPELMATVLVPKTGELVADPARQKGEHKKKDAEKEFLQGMGTVLARVRRQSVTDIPLTIFYAFKQSETQGESAVSTGWETFLAALVAEGFAIVGTWPIRTEQTGGLRNEGRNSLATSVVLVCRPRPVDAPSASRRDFLAALKAELPTALAHLQASNIAPVDLAQAAIGPGMAIYTRYGRVTDAAGKPVVVRDALAMINEVLDEVLAGQEGDVDADTRWALAWFEQSGFEEGDFGVAESLSKAKNTAVAGLVEAGIVRSSPGKVRLLRPSELPASWDPTRDPRLTVWETVHQLVRALEGGGDAAAAALVKKLGSKAETARELAYRLYALSERKKRATDALSYNGLVQSWPEIQRLAAGGAVEAREQTDLFGAED